MALFLFKKSRRADLRVKSFSNWFAAVEERLRVTVLGPSSGATAMEWQLHLVAVGEAAARAATFTRHSLSAPFRLQTMENV